MAGARLGCTLRNSHTSIRQARFARLEACDLSRARRSALGALAAGKLLGDTAAVTALLDRLLHHAYVLKCGPRSWRTKVQTDLRTDEGTK